MPELADLFFYLAVLVFVIALIAVGAWLLRGLMSGSNASMGGLLRRGERRLGVVEAASVDGRRKLVLLRRDNVEHLIMLGGPVDVLIETGIQTPRPAPDRGVETQRNERGGITFARDELRQDKDSFGDD